jgi:hypothetical protein
MGAVKLTNRIAIEFVNEPATNEANCIAAGVVDVGCHIAP